MDNNLNISSIQKKMVKNIIMELGVDTDDELGQLMQELINLLGDDVVISWREVN
jgi:hypothetical protein